jgi:hypothetical protein
MLLDYTVDQNHIDIDREDINLVGRLIKGEQPTDPNFEKSISFILLIKLFRMDV